MLALVLLSTIATLSTAADESVELKPIYSEYQLDGTEIDSYFLCKVCGARLQWFVNGRDSGGFSNSNVAGIVKRSKKRNFVYWSVLLRNAIHEDYGFCLTSLMLVQHTGISEVTCRGNHQYTRITEFRTDSTYNNRSAGIVNVDYVYFEELVFSGMYNYTYIVRCQVQDGQSLSWYVDKVLVQNFTAASMFELVHLMPQNNVSSHAILLKRSHGSTLTVILLVFVLDYSTDIQVSCQAGGNTEDRVDFSLPLRMHFSGDDTIESDTTAEILSMDSNSKKSSLSEGSTSPTDITQSYWMRLKTYVGLIPGIIVGVIVLIIAVPVVVLVLKCRKDKQKRKQQFDSEINLGCDNEEDDKEPFQVVSIHDAQKSVLLLNAFSEQHYETDSWI